MTDTDLETSSHDDAVDDFTRCRDLVVLLFRAVLRRDPEESDAVAFTNAVQGGMPIYDFVSELMCTLEFPKATTPVPTLPPPISPTATAPEVGTRELLSLSLGLLQARLVDKGCRIQLGPLINDAGDHGAGTASMERVMRTLAVLDAL